MQVLSLARLGILTRRHYIRVSLKEILVGVITGGACGRQRCCSDAGGIGGVPGQLRRPSSGGDILKQIPVLPSFTANPYTAPRFPELLVVASYAVEFRYGFMPSPSIGAV